MKSCKTYYRSQERLVDSLLFLRIEYVGDSFSLILRQFPRVLYLYTRLSALCYCDCLTSLTAMSAGQTQRLAPVLPAQGAPAYPSLSRRTVGGIHSRQISDCVSQ